LVHAPLQAGLENQRATAGFVVADLLQVGSVSCLRSKKRVQRFGRVSSRWKRSSPGSIWSTTSDGIGIVTCTISASRFDSRRSLSHLTNVRFRAQAGHRTPEAHRSIRWYVSAGHASREIIEPSTRGVGVEAAPCRRRSRSSVSMTDRPPRIEREALRRGLRAQRPVTQSFAPP